MNSVKYLLVESSKRNSGSAQNFTTQIPAVQHATRVSLISASIPNTLYNITGDNGTIYWTQAGARTATLSPGAYSVSALVVALASAMETVDATQTYNVSYSATTMKITITCSAPIGLTCSNSSVAIWDTLGFSTGADRAPATSHEGDDVLRLDFPSYLLISIAEFSPAGVVSTDNFRGNFAVAMDINSQYIQIYGHKNSFDNLSEYTSRNGINSLTVRLLKPDGTLADLNGANWSFLLQFDYCQK